MSNAPVWLVVLFMPIVLVGVIAGVITSPIWFPIFLLYKSTQEFLENF